MPFTCERLLTARGVPHLHRPIFACRRQPFPIRAKHYAPCLASMTLRAEPLLTARVVPHLRRLISACCRESFSIGTKRYAHDLGGVPFNIHQVGMSQVIPVMPFKAAQIL